jgi:hypothetical protein
MYLGEIPEWPSCVAEYSKLDMAKPRLKARHINTLRRVTPQPQYTKSLCTKRGSARALPPSMGFLAGLAKLDSVRVWKKSRERKLNMGKKRDRMKGRKLVSDPRVFHI